MDSHGDLHLTAFEDRTCQSNHPVYKLLDKYHGSHFWSGNAVNYEILYNGFLPYALQAIEAVRTKYGKEKPIVIVYEDLPWNDFKSLFFLTQGLFEDQKAFLPQDKNVFILASGTNFYERCLPPNYVDLAVSCYAMQWLSKRPCNLPWDITCQGDKVSQEELDAYKRQAAEDWETILMHRATELKPGAHIIIVAMSTKDGVYPGSTVHYKVKVIPYLRDLWFSFVTEGRITKEEFAKTNIAFCHRSEDEFKAPFLREDSKVMKAGLKLVSIKIKDAHIDYSLETEVGETLDGEPLSVNQKARRYVNVFRAWAEAIFTSALNECRSEEEKNAIADAFFGRFEEDVASNPNDFGYDMILAYIDIMKTKPMA